MNFCSSNFYGIFHVGSHMEIIELDCQLQEIGRGFLRLCVWGLRDWLLRSGIVCIGIGRMDIFSSVLKPHHAAIV